MQTQGQAKSVQTKVLLGDEDTSGRQGSGTAWMWREQPSQTVQGALCTSRDEKHYCDASSTAVFLFSDICLCQSNFCVTCGMSLFHTAISMTLL